MLGPITALKPGQQIQRPHISPARMQARIACGKLVDGLDSAHLDELLNAIAHRFYAHEPERELFEGLARYLGTRDPESRFTALDGIDADLRRMIEAAEAALD